jgi:hypothetical protein
VVSGKVSAWTDQSGGIEAGTIELVKISEYKPIWRFSSQHIELVVQHKALRLIGRWIATGSLAE